MKLEELDSDVRDLILRSLDSVDALDNLCEACSTMDYTFKRSMPSIIDDVFRNQFGSAYGPAYKLLFGNVPKEDEGIVDDDSEDGTEEEDRVDDDEGSDDEGLEGDDRVNDASGDDKQASNVEPAKRDLNEEDIVAIRELYYLAEDLAGACTFLILGSSQYICNRVELERTLLAIIYFTLYCDNGLDLREVPDARSLLYMLGLYNFFQHVIKYRHDGSFDIEDQIMFQGPRIMLDIYERGEDCKCVECAPNDSSLSNGRPYRNFFIKDFMKAMRAKGYDPSQICAELLEGAIFDDDQDLVDDYLREDYDYSSRRAIFGEFPFEFD